MDTGMDGLVFNLMLDRLDIPDLVAFCCVCREWYEYLNANERVWKLACKNSGLRQTMATKPREWTTWKEYAILIMRRTNEARTSNCFRRHFSIDVAEMVVGIYYHNNKLAVATVNKIEMWCTTSNRLLFYKENPFENLYYVSVKFDDLHIMVENTMQAITCFSASTREEETEYHFDIKEYLNCFDFESRCDIVVAMLDNLIIRIWELSSGELVQTLKTLQSIDANNVELVFIRSPTPNDRGLVYLSCVDKRKLLTWTVRVGDDITSKDGIECPEYPTTWDINSPEWFLRNESLANRVLSHNGFVYYSEASAPDSDSQQSASSESCVINEFDLKTCKISRKIKTNEIIKNLLAVGEKYIAFYTAGEEGVGKKILVIEKASGELVAKYEATDDIDSGFKDHISVVVFGDGNWLDGLDLTNDRGVLFAYRGEDGSVHIVKWIPRNEFAV